MYIKTKSDIFCAPPYSMYVIYTKKKRSFENFMAGICGCMA